MTTLREALEQAMPDAIIATERPTLAAPAKRGEALTVNLLATNDIVIKADTLPAVAAYLRDTLGYALLTNVTAVDYLANELIEVVYHFVRPQGGTPEAIKVRLDRAKPELPSLTAQWPGADLQEREAYDLFGVTFIGHPNLRRIYMWDEFAGFPMRKDFPKQGDKYFMSSET
jgi:NADH-quinone oxidoreductase subunit C